MNWSRAFPSHRLFVACRRPYDRSVASAALVHLSRVGVTDVLRFPLPSRGLSPGVVFIGAVEQGGQGAGHVAQIGVLLLAAGQPRRDHHDAVHHRRMVPAAEQAVDTRQGEGGATRARGSGQARAHQVHRHLAGLRERGHPAGGCGGAPASAGNCRRRPA